MVKKNKSVKPRNPHAIAPILRKGGPHQKSKTTKRREAKKIIAQELTDKDV